jgi:hypothetical protein
MTDMTDDQVRALLDGATENAYDLAVVKWGGGIRCVYLNDYRVAGEKPWGGGDTTRRFKVRMADIMQAFRGTVQAAAPDLARALIASEAARKLAEERLREAKLAFENVDAQVEDEGEFSERSWEQLRAALAEVQARDDASTPPADTPEGQGNG